MLFLSESDRERILQIARESVRTAVDRSPLPISIPLEGIFATKCGVFVTLHVRGNLRGCIGVVEPHEPLATTLPECAASAALSDPRFSSINPDELRDVSIEVSLLSPLQPIEPSEIQLGTHGLLVELGGRRGLLLPQVASEHHLNRDRFLAETSRKAGLPPDGWKNPDARIFGFTCEIVGPEPR